MRVAVSGEGRDVSVVGIHFYRIPEERLAQPDFLTSYFRQAEHPVILAGDVEKIGQPNNLGGVAGVGSPAALGRLPPPVGARYGRRRRAEAERARGRGRPIWLTGRQSLSSGP